jgi:hypothetical protein
MTLKHILPFLAASIAVSSAAYAQSYDGFAYREFTALEENGGGDGWFTGDNWTQITGNFNVDAKSLVVSDSRLATSGNHVVSVGNTTSFAARKLAKPAPAQGEFWASVVVDANGFGGGLSFSNTNAETNNNLNLFAADFKSRPRFGFGINGRNFIYVLDGQEVHYITELVPGAPNTQQNSPPVLLVAKFDVTNGFFTLWANPALGGASPQGGIVVAKDVPFNRSGSRFSNDVSFVAVFANWAGVQLDEVRLGTSFADVAPVR